MRLRPHALVLACLVTALAPAAAHAATTVGSDLSKPASLAACVTSCTAFSTFTSSGAPVAVAPANGVIVRWRVKAGAPVDGVALRTIRAADNGSYAGVDASTDQSVPAGTSTFDTRLPVQAGDIVGLDMPAHAMVFAASSTIDAQIFTPQLNSFSHIPSQQTGRELLVNADIEPDVDGDGYGDETQDLCPTDPSRHAACLANLSVSARPAPAPLTVARPLTYTIKVSNDGPSTAENVGLVVNVPFGATPLSARTGRGSCSGGATFSCRLGAIAAGDSVTVLLTVRPELVGTLFVTGQTSTSTDETSTDDDSFTSDVTVLAPTLRLLDVRLTHLAIRVGGATTIRWYQTDTAKVTVSVQQISRRGRILPRGSFFVTGRPGSNALAFHGRIPRRARLKPGNYRFTVSAATLDGRAAAPRHLSFSVRRRGR